MRNMVEVSVLHCFLHKENLFRQAVHNTKRSARRTPEQVIDPPQLVQPSWRDTSSAPAATNFS